MENSVLAQCGFRDDEFAKFFHSISQSGIKNTKTASILRQIFGEVMSGVTQETGETGFLNPIACSGKRDLGSLWKSFGGTTATNAIALSALKRGAKFSEVRKFLRAFNGERYAYGAFFPKRFLDAYASEIHCDTEGEYSLGVFDEEGTLLTVQDHKVHRVGRAYFVEGFTGAWHWSGASAGEMWVK